MACCSCFAFLAVPWFFLGGDVWERFWITCSCDTEFKAFMHLFGDALRVSRSPALFPLPVWSFSGTGWEGVVRWRRSHDELQRQGRTTRKRASARNQHRMVSISFVAVRTSRGRHRLLVPGQRSETVRHVLGSIDWFVEGCAVPHAHQHSEEETDTRASAQAQRRHSHTHTVCSSLGFLCALWHFDTRQFGGLCPRVSNRSLALCWECFCFWMLLVSRWTEFQEFFVRF